MCPSYEPRNHSMALANIKARITQEKILTTGRYCQTFMPKGSLSRFLNIENVTNALADPVFNIPFHKRNDTAVDIIEEGQSVFAILLEMNGERYLSSFIENHNLDSSLPIPSSVLSDIMPHNGALFERLQKDYYVHSFRKSQYRRTLPDTITLPFLSQESLKEGGYSSVYAVKVHPAHQNFFNQSESKVRFDVADR